jgi:hypothetical protein
MNHPVTKVILELDSQIQTLSQMKNLAENLKTHIANCFTAWFKCQNLSSEASLIEAFLSPLVQANPHGIFSIVLETETSFPIEILEELLAYASNPDHFLNRYYLFSSYEENIIYSTQFVIVLPLHQKDQMDPKWLEDLEDCVPVIWSWKISSEKEIQRTLKALQDKDGILVEFPPDLDEETLQKILQRIKKIASDDPDWIQFRDAGIQRIWDQEDDETPPACEIEEKVIHYTTTLEALESYLPRAIF